MKAGTDSSARKKEAGEVLLATANAISRCESIRRPALSRMGAGRRNLRNERVPIQPFFGTTNLIRVADIYVNTSSVGYGNVVYRVGAALVVVLGLAMVSQGGALAGVYAPWDLQGTTSLTEAKAEVAGGVQIVRSTLSPSRYPDIKVKAGTVRYSCWMGMVRGSIFVSEPES